MENSAFITGTPLVRASAPRRERKGRRRPARASGAAPPPPSGAGSTGEPGGKDEKRTHLERLLSLEMVPTKGRKAECACIFCHGAKMRRCSWCDGRGFRQELQKRTWEELQTDIQAMQADPSSSKSMNDMPKINVQCSACTGSKMMRCGYCRGSGAGSYGHSY